MTQCITLDEMSRKGKVTDTEAHHYGLWWEVGAGIDCNQARGNCSRIGL